MNLDSLYAVLPSVAIVEAEAVDRQIQRGFWRLTFEPRLEQAYVRETYDALRVYRVYAAFVGMLLFDSYIVVDWTMLPDVLVTAVILRFLVATPLILLGIYVGARSRAFNLCELIYALMGIVLTSLGMALLLRSHSAYRLDYRYGNMLIILNTAVAQRLRFRFAMAGTIGIVIVVLAGMRQCEIIDTPLYWADATFFVSGAALVLFASYALECDHRRRYILSMKSAALDRRLELSANLDPLTGLWNRRYLDEAMRAAWAEAEAEVRMAVLLLDIDRFKVFNDTYGHLEGDRCLERIGLCLRNAMAGEAAVLARFGGEEFLVFARHVDETGAIAMAERLRRAIRAEAIPHPVLGQGAIVTASLGVAAAPVLERSVEGLIAAADEALYRAKSGGRDCVKLAPGLGMNEAANIDGAESAA